MNSSWIEIKNNVSSLYSFMLEDAADVLRHSGSPRLQSEMVPLLKKYVSRSYDALELIGSIRSAYDLGRSLPSSGKGFNLSEKDYDALKSLFAEYEKRIISALSDALDVAKAEGNTSKAAKVLRTAEKTEGLFAELNAGVTSARNAFETDSRRYIELIAGLPLITIDEADVDVILGDYSIGTDSIQESALFDSSLEKLGNYVVNLLNVSGKKPISAILCRVNMEDADAILSAFGNACERGTLVSACKAVMKLCKNYITTKSMNVILEINDSVPDAKNACQSGCDSLRRVNAVSYFKPRPSVIGFFDPVFPDIIFVRECDYASGEGIGGLSESEIYDLQTAVHEYLHYCSHGPGQSGLINYSSYDDHYAAVGFNEGLTEYLAIHTMDKVLDARELAEGRSYPDQVAVVSELVKLFGLEFMISCYTSGNLQSISRAVDDLIADDEEPEPWKMVAGYMSVLQKTMSGYGENPDGTPYTWGQREKIMKECRDHMLRILRKGRNKHDR